ncbi:MAG: nitroreductase family protein [Clostridiales bacterium]
MELSQAINKRYSYRGKFTDAIVPRCDLVKIVKAGLAAPSGCNRQTPQFIALDDKNLIAEFAKIIGLPKTATATAAICVVSCPKPAVDGKSYAAQDYAAAIENMLLTIVDLGYATCWIEGQIHADGVNEKLEALLNLPQNVNLAVYLPLGVAEEPQANPVKSKILPNRGWFNKYGEEEIK